MNAKKCDICGAFYGINTGKTTEGYVLSKKMDKNKETPLDLCPDCQKMLDAWISGNAVIDMISNPEDGTYGYEFNDDGVVTIEKKKGEPK